MPTNHKNSNTDTAIKKRSKSQKEQHKNPSSPKNTVFDGFGLDLPNNLIINSVVDSKGYQTGCLLLEAIDPRKNPIREMLSVKDLALGRCDELAHFVVKAKLAGQLSPKRLRALAATLTEYDGQEAHVVQRDGYHCLVIDGQRYGFYVMGDNVHNSIRTFL
jgi:hypothetical protein